MHPKQTTKWLVHIPRHLWVLGQATGTLDHKTHHNPDSGEATTFPHIVYSAARGRGYIQMAQIPGTPKLKSRNCPEIVPVRVSGLWELITPDSRIRSQRGLNQSFSPRQDLSNAVSHSQIECREEVDSRLLVVGSQIANLTPGPSFSHNLGYRCPNDQCEAIFDIYASRPFQWHQEHPNARCFAPCCRALNIRESRRTPTPNFSKCWASPPHLAKVGVRHKLCIYWCGWHWIYGFFLIHLEKYTCQWLITLRYPNKALFFKLLHVHFIYVCIIKWWLFSHIDHLQVVDGAIVSINCKD
jgi:hypothetical protein